MVFKPLHDRVMIRREAGEQITKGGIIIPQAAQEKPVQGVIVAHGPGAHDEKGKFQPIGVKVGDRVLFSKWAGTEISINGELFLIIKENELIGIFDGEEDDGK